MERWTLKFTEKAGRAVCVHTLNNVERVLMAVVQDPSTSVWRILVKHELNIKDVHCMQRKHQVRLSINVLIYILDCIWSEFLLKFLILRSFRTANKPAHLFAFCGLYKSVCQYTFVGCKVTFKLSVWKQMDRARVAHPMWPKPHWSFLYGLFKIVGLPYPVVHIKGMGTNCSRLWND